MKRFHQPLFALLMSLLLLASQQAAFEHLLGHLRTSAATETSYQQDNGVADKLAEACTACVAFANMGGNAPPVDTAVFIPFAAGGVYFASLALAPLARRVGLYLARAPPAFS